MNARNKIGYKQFVRKWKSIGALIAVAALIFFFPGLAAIKWVFQSLIVGYIGAFVYIELKSQVHLLSVVVFADAVCYTVFIALIRMAFSQSFQPNGVEDLMWLSMFTAVILAGPWFGRIFTWPTIQRLQIEVFQTV